MLGASECLDVSCDLVLCLNRSLRPAQSNMGYTIALDTHCFNKTRNLDGSPNCSKEVYGTCGGRACVWNAGREVADMKNFPHIRLMDVQSPPTPDYKPEFEPVAQAGSLGWHRPDQYAAACRGNYSDCRPDMWGVTHCGCSNFTSASGCCSPDASGIWRQDENTFSAACWFFARDLYASLDPPRPVGVMNNAVGGTSDQLWSSPAAIDSCKHLGKPWEWPSNYSSSTLWNALVVPLSRHVISGVAWYQGEANAAVGPPGSTQSYWLVPISLSDLCLWCQICAYGYGMHVCSRCHQCLIGAVNCSAPEKVLCQTPSNPSADGRTYLCSFAAMVKSWRELWANNTQSATDPEFPFGWVQLNSFGQPDGPRGHAGSQASSLRNGTEDPLGAWAPGFPSIRWAQTQSLALVPNSFQAVVLDTPSPSGAIHSCFKQPVGSRLARGALATAYGRPELHRSPAVSAAHLAGETVVVTVVNASRLALRASLGFEVLTGGSAPAWISAPILRTDGERTVTLSLANATAGAAPTAVRYLWSNTPCGAGTYGCPLYVDVPALGALTGENTSVPLGPAILPISPSPAAYEGHK